MPHSKEELGQLRKGAEARQQRNDPAIIQQPAARAGQTEQTPDTLLEKSLAAKPRLPGHSRLSHPQRQAPPRRIKLLTHLALAALLGMLLLTLSLWLGGFHLPFLPATPPQPSLTISSGPYRVGAVIKLQGANFSRYTIVALLLDGEPAIDTNGLRQAVNTDDQGAFTATLTITPDWGAGDHIIGAEDTTSRQQALVSITVETRTAHRAALPLPATGPDLLTRYRQQG